MIPAELAERLLAGHPDVLLARDEVTMFVDRSELLPMLRRLREEPELGFDFLSSITATDWPGRSPRFWLAYELSSTAHKHRVRLKVGLPEEDPHAPSIVEIFPGANWHEREVYDFFGIVFDGHPDLRRILMPDDWVGHPLRRDEELGGVNTRYKGAFIPPVDRRSG